MNKTAGIILVGGQSSRMGKNKSLLVFQGIPMVEHMRNILVNAGIRDTYMSGTLPGYETIPDPEPQAGPGRAMAHLLHRFSGQHQRLFFVPVDMPFMTEDIVRMLVASPGSVFVKGHPVPCCLLTRDGVPEGFSVKDLLKESSATDLEIPRGSEKYFLNLNTPEEWERVIQSASRIGH